MSCFPLLMLVAFLLAVLLSVAALVGYEAQKAERLKEEQEAAAGEFASAIRAELRRVGYQDFNLEEFASDQGVDGDIAAAGAIVVFKGVCRKALEDRIVTTDEQKLLDRLGSALDLDRAGRAQLLKEAHVDIEMQRKLLEPPVAPPPQGKKSPEIVEESPSRNERFIYSKVAGVTFANDDGSSRPAIIRKHCSDGTALKAVREPRNQYDPSAIALYVQAGRRMKQIGYIGSHLAADLAPKVDRGASLEVSVTEVTGGTSGKATGVNIEILISEERK